MCSRDGFTSSQEARSLGGAEAETGPERQLARHFPRQAQEVSMEDTLLERESSRRKDVAWNLTRLPEFSGGGPHRLFVAVGGVWQGYFVLRDEILWSPEDARCPYALLFDPHSWVDIKPLKTKRFRGFT